VLFLSKDIKHEASWVLQNHGSLYIAVWGMIASCLDGGHTMSLRHVGNSVYESEKRGLMWANAACFRFMNIYVPESRLHMGDPGQFTSHFVEIACLFGKSWEDRTATVESAPPATYHVRIEIGSIFHQMFPFNIESQAEEK
jgi:hypothetical protein